MTRMTRVRMRRMKRGGETKNADEDEEDDDHPVQPKRPSSIVAGRQHIFFGESDDSENEAQNPPPSAASPVSVEHTSHVESHVPEEPRLPNTKPRRASQRTASKQVEFQSTFITLARNKYKCKCIENTCFLNMYIVICARTYTIDLFLAETKNSTRGSSTYCSDRSWGTQRSTN